MLQVITWPSPPQVAAHWSGTQIRMMERGVMSLGQKPGDWKWIDLCLEKDI